jgi:quercetin dioxygenase-like cupin family protein
MVFRGKIEVRIDGSEPLIMLPGDSVKVPPNVMHGGTALEDTWLIAVSVPRLDSYPKS